MLCTTILHTYISMAEIYEVINLSQANREGCQCVMSGGVRGTRDRRNKGRAFVGVLLYRKDSKFLYVMSQLFPTLPPTTLNLKSRMWFAWTINAWTTFKSKRGKVANLYPISCLYRHKRQTRITNGDQYCLTFQSSFSKVLSRKRLFFVLN